MPQGTKIATCCYCGTRAALVLTGERRHELACSSCGAPLHDLKMLRKEDVRATSGMGTKTKPKSKPRKESRKTSSATPLPVWERKARKVKKKKSRKGLARAFLEEAFDVIEDIFD